jgi:hypothetical protein
VIHTRRDRPHVPSCDDHLFQDPHLTGVGRLRIAQLSRIERDPRISLPISATEAALVSGVLSQPADTELHSRLYAWRDEVNGFNHRLELTELRLFTASLPADEAGEFERALHREDGYLNDIRRHVKDLRDYLAFIYPSLRSS